MMLLSSFISKLPKKKSENIADGRRVARKLISIFTKNIIFQFCLSKQNIHNLEKEVLQIYGRHSNGHKRIFSINNCPPHFWAKTRGLGGKFVIELEGLQEFKQTHFYEKEKLYRFGW